jgi:hypothetical protein
MDNLQLLFAAVMQLLHSFHHFSYLRENACRSGFVMELLQDAKLLVQAVDGSMEKHFFSGCNSLLNKSNCNQKISAGSGQP